MWTIFMMQWKRLFKQPFVVLTFFGLTLLFVTFLGQGQSSPGVTVQTYTTNLPNHAYEELVERLNRTDDFNFKINDQETVEGLIRNNRLSFAVQLEQDTYEFIVGQSSFSQPLTNQYLNEVYQEVRWLLANDLTEDVLETFVPLEVTSRDTSGSAIEFQAQVIVGMTLYFVMYTVLFQMMSIAEQKTDGTWERMMLSPVSKFNIYSGLFLYYFLIGFIQVGVSFLIFTEWLGFSFGEQYSLLLLSISFFLISIVALGLMLVSVVRTPQQLQAVIPIVATASAMLGGAFWPLEFVTQPWLLAFSRFIPIRYGIESLSDVIVRSVAINDLLVPYSLLLGLTIIFGGVGFYFIEKQRK
ncbi:ABC transporter [Halolactibacillus alkaliphilus]|uniref:ABC transporter n=1 Tax=Halolactibacillus alkaliphilus TaxID=442899 RepID=A0A511X031_9BACI|nr:ABC transporter permease [Halolactibacillus alkaliphilus]GEN56298.1 ABC transporter [Halolactibacillus alkaliphilus]GGN67783.1 ABC transporter [Halolactibacillus alkaliphilus]SFO79299.1 ABC-2 type transport system permease protein [Halolactibacillus alkaliphilus]